MAGFRAAAMRRSAIALLGLAGPFAMAPVKADAGVTAPEQAQLQAALQQAGDEAQRGDHAQCRRTLEAVRDIAWRAHGSASHRWPDLMANCTFGTDGRPVGAAPTEELLALLDPWRLRLQNNPENAPDEEIAFLNRYWRLLIQFGQRELADRVFFPEVQRRIGNLASRPGDAVTSSELMFLARSMYGSWMIQDDTRKLYEQLRDGLGAAHPATLVTMRALAYGEGFLGRPQSALALAEQAVELAQQHHANDRNLLLGLTAERSQARTSVGRFAEGLADMLQVRDALLQRAPPPMEGLVRTHYNLAGIALEMGDYAAAIAYADQSIDHAQRSGIPMMLIEARVPGAIREVARLMLGEPGAAQDLKAALEPTNADEMHIGSEAFALVHHAARVGDPALLAWSVAFMNTYIRRFRVPFHSDYAIVPLMRAWQRAGIALRAPEVRDDLALALAGSITGRSLSTEALTQFSTARHLAATQQPDEAAWLYKRGANALQRLRQGLPSGNAELHRAWLSSHEGDLREFIGLLIDRGRLVEAEQAVLFLRDEEMAEYTRRSRAQRTAAVQALSYTAAEADRNVGFDALAQRVREAAAAADQRADAWRTPDYKTRYRDEEGERALAGFQREVHELLAPQPAPAQRAPQLRGSAGRELAPGTARVTYFVREGGIDIVMQRGHSLQRRSVPIARDALNRRVQDLRAALNSPQREVQAASRALHDVLVAPMAGWLAAGHIVRLQITPDASLRYVPFAALHDGRRWLAQRFVLSTDLNGSAARIDAPALARSAATSFARGDAPTAPRGAAPPPTHGVLAFGRSTGDGEHSALPGVERELAAVAQRHGGRHSEQHSGTALNEAFTAASLQRGLAGQPALVHIASHFVLSPAGEDKSYLLLGDGQRLSLTELRQLPWQGVQLALLSACDSAVTVDAGHGRELVGFATALQSAGVRNVLASLWRVSDGATAQWMEMFYAQRATRSSAPVSANALAQTQRRWLRTHAGTPLEHPHYWAAFSWMGTP